MLTIAQNDRPSLKIMHTADVHLGDDYNPEAARRGFLAVLQRTVSEQADMLIIAGDLFDSSRAARAHLPFALAELNKLDIPVVLLPGNHDPYEVGSVYREVNVQTICPRLHLITAAEGEVVEFPELRLVLWGKPVIEHSPHFRPLDNVPPRRGDYWHIVVAHGLHVADGEEIYRSSRILNEDIAQAGWDYLALGHIHPFRDVSQGEVIACYSGSPSYTLEASGGNAVLVALRPDAGVEAIPIDLDP